MGYSGLGMQRWISNMKPRKFMGKRSKPDGGGMENIIDHDINDYYHLKPTKLDNLFRKRFSPLYRRKLEKEIKAENRKNFIFNIVSFLIAVALILALIIFLSIKFDLI